MNRRSSQVDDANFNRRKHIRESSDHFCWHFLTDARAERCTTSEAAVDRQSQAEVGASEEDAALGEARC